jgi:PhoPQ-activated pathogenicity-related protein
MTDSLSDILDALLDLDASFAWKMCFEKPGAGYSCAVLSLTSQTWSPAIPCDRQTWHHWMTVIIPDNLDTNIAYLNVGGGQNDGPPPDEPLSYHAKMAMETKSIVIELGQVPNQPIRFADSPDIARNEDGLIAYLMARHDGSRGASAMIRAPMVRSVVAAMTATQQFLESKQTNTFRVRGFVLSGGSKRGWATWLAGLADPRVVGIIPVVINVLDVNATTRHHWQSLGYFSPALKDYVKEGILPDKIDTDVLNAVNAVEDPINYLGHPRMAIPKLIIVASGDEFFPVDNTRFSYDRLPAPKHLRVLPNSDHSTVGSDINATKAAWFSAIAHGQNPPGYDWSVSSHDLLTVMPDFSPSKVLLWQAWNPNARDFAIASIGPAFTSTELTRDSDGFYRTGIAAPQTGFCAYFVELRCPVLEGLEARFTTEALIRPDRLPFRWKNSVA